MSIRCEQVRQQLALYAVEALDQEAHREIDLHLVRCHGCSEALASLRQVEGLAREAPLRPASPNDLEGRVFAHVQAPDAAQAAPKAALGPEPPSDLERRSLERAGVLAPVKPVKQRVAVALAPAFAAAAAVLSFMYMDARNDASSESTGSSSPRTSPVIAGAAADVPVGHPMQTIEMTGDAAAADLELVHFRHDNYRLALHAADMPGCSDKTFYEVWLREEDGTEISAGSFRIAKPDDIVFSFNVGIDPAEYYLVEVTREPMGGDSSKQGPVVMTGTLDPTHVEHD